MGGLWKASLRRGHVLRTKEQGGTGEAEGASVRQIWCVQRSESTSAAAQGVLGLVAERAKS